MLARRIEGFTREMAKDQKEYFTLCIRDEVLHGVQCMTSAWELTPTELVEIRDGAVVRASVLTSTGSAVAAIYQLAGSDLYKVRKGASIYLHVVGTVFPPVCMEVIQLGDSKPMSRHAAVSIGEVPDEHL